MLLWFATVPVPPAVVTNTGDLREHGWLLDGSRLLIRHGIPLRTQERMR